MKKQNKGKQKARDDIENIRASIIIKFSDSSIPDFTLHVADLKSVTVSDLRRDIRNAVGGRMLNRRLRLIRNGRVLNDKTDLFHDILGSDAGETAEVKSNIYIHCSIGDILSPTELAKEHEFDQKVPTRSTLPEQRGFDRLRSTGFSDEDIAQLRQEFGQLHGYGTNQDMTNMEEEWIDTGVRDGNTDVTLGGDYVDDLVGLLVGMFLGVFSLFFLRETNIFSDRQQKSIFAGIVVNISFAFLRNLM